LGELLQKQPDPDEPKSAFNSFLVDLDPKNNSKTGKKQAHEMCGVLLTLLFYMVLSKSGNKLEELMGRKKLLEYVKLFDLTLLMESFLTQPKLSKAAVDAAEKNIPKYIKDFCSCVKREREKGKDVFA